MMITTTKVPDKGDPSDILQLFPSYNIQLLCCRYWWLRRWEFEELSYPYWRIYHNNTSGASIIRKGRDYQLTPDKILMIAPNTSYSTKLHEHHSNYENKDALIGGRVGDTINYSDLVKKNYILHLFIHFNIGLPYDNVQPGIFEFELTDHLNEKLTVIRNHLKVDYAKFSFYSGLAIQSLISDLLSAIPEARWDLMSKDYRILDILGHIENNISGDLSNVALAKKIPLATNAFTRLFSSEIGISPQRFVKKKRIDNACVLLHHSDKTIEAIAEETGFSDRYHFSRIFKQITGVSPARYQKEYRMK